MLTDDPGWRRMKVRSGIVLSEFCLRSPFARSLLIAAAFFVRSGLGLGAHAQQGGIVAVSPDIPDLIGVGFGIAPDYEGSDDVTFGVLPAGQLTYASEHSPHRHHAVGQPRQSRILPARAVTQLPLRARRRRR